MTAQNKNLRVVLVSAVCFVFILSIFSYKKISSLIESAALVNHTTQITLDLEKFIGKLKDTETAYSDYLLTQNKLFLERFTKDLKEYSPYIQALKQLVIDNPEQQKSLASIELLAKHREDYLLKILEIDKLRTPTTPELLTGKAIMDSLRNEVNIMIARENRLMEHRNNELRNQQLIAPSMLLLLSFMTLIILFISYWQLNKSFLNTQQLQNEVINKNVQLEKNKQIEASQKELNLLIKQAPVAITLLKGEDLLLQAANEIALQMMGKTEQEVTNKSLSEIFPELTERQNIYKQVYKTGIPYEGKEVEVNFKRYGENYTGYYNLNYLPWYSSEGKIKGLMGVGVDMSAIVLARKKIEESEKQFSILANNIQNLAWIADGTGWIYWYNKRWYDYTGTTLEEVQGWGWEIVLHPEHIERVVTFLTKAWKINEPWELTFPLRDSDGIYRTFLTRAFPICNEKGEIRHWIGTNTDIEEQKIREEKKDEFISIASHEMKTPLTTAKAYLQLLEHSLDKNDRDSTLFAKKASQSLNRLNELVTELLDVSKIQFGKLNYTVSDFNFNEMIESTVENIQLTSQTHTIIKTGIVNDVITGDKDRLQQVIVNLLNNAIKYSPRADKVFITVAHEKDMIKVEVKDTGIGMSRQSLTKIFDKYHRIEEHAIHFQGLGIGLFISYEIIQRHHGKLWAESEPGKGSTFYFTLPVNQIMYTA